MKTAPMKATAYKVMSGEKWQLVIGADPGETHDRIEAALPDDF